LFNDPTNTKMKKPPAIQGPETEEARSQRLLAALSDEQVENVLLDWLKRGWRYLPLHYRQCDVYAEHKKRFPKMYLRKGQPSRFVA